MGKHDKEPKQSPIYEAILPEWRFKELAQAVLMKHAQEAERTHNKLELTWPESEEGSDHYKLQYQHDFNHWFGGRQVTYTLDHYQKDQPSGQPKTRWQVTERQNGTLSQFKVTDEQNREKKLDTAAKRTEAATALRILTTIEPEAAKQIFDRTIDHQYSLMIGNYILSHLALEGADHNLGIDVVWYAVQSHEEHVATIESEEIKRARRRRAKKYPQPHYREAVKDAVETRRTPTVSNRYVAPDILGSADIVAARANRVWKNTIPAEIPLEES